MYGFETFLAVVIVCIDDDKRSLDDLLRCKHSLNGSPRLCPAFRQSSRDIVDILESVVHSYIMRRANRGNAVSDDFFKLLLGILADDKYHMIETASIASPTGSNCLIPVPKRLPIPAAMISNVVFITSSSYYLLFHCYTLRQISRLIHIQALGYRHIVAE